MQIMAKPNVWKADIHLTDRIIVQFTFYRLITGTQDCLSVFLPVWVCLLLYFSTPGDFRAYERGGCPRR